MHLTARQHGEYLLLLMFSWKQDRPLPKADVALRAIARASEHEWAEDKDTVLAFFQEGQDGYRQKRLEEERAEATERFNSLKARSALGVAARLSKLPRAAPEVIPEVKLEADTTHNSHSSNELKKMSVFAKTDEFEEFWKAYPKTQNMSKAAALKAWQKQKNRLPAQEILLQAVAKYRAFLAAETKKNGREYPAKHAQGWLNEERWIGFMAQPESQATTSHVIDWADEFPQWRSFKAELQPVEWQAWFAGTHPNGSVSTLIVGSEFTADRIAQKYGPRLQALFGEGFSIKVGP